MASGNGVKKLADKLPALIPQPNGGALYAGGVVGHKGAGGRPPDEHREWLKSVVRDPGARKVFESHVKAGDIRFWDHAAKYGEEPSALHASAELELPNGVKFKMQLGERDLADD